MVSEPRGDAYMWARVLKLDRLLREGGNPSVEALVRLWNVSERTVHNTRRFMQRELGLPLRYSRYARGYCYTEVPTVLPASFLVEAEVVALDLARILAARFAGASLSGRLEAAVEKLCERAGGDRVDAIHVMGAAPPEPWPGVVETLLTACRARRVTTFTYFTARLQQTEKRFVEPHVVSNLLGSWRLIGWDQRRNGVRVFTASRMSDLSMGKEKFTERPQVTEAIEASLFGDVGGPAEDVVIAVSPWQSPWIRERALHPSQWLEETEGGGLLLRLRVSVTNDLARWVLSHGGHLEVREPQTLRERVAREAAALLERHGK